MPQYAVKIAEVHIISKTPISDAERRTVVKMLRDDPEKAIREGFAVVRV